MMMMMIKLPILPCAEKMICLDDRPRPHAVNHFGILAVFNRLLKLLL